MKNKDKRSSFVFMLDWIPLIRILTKEETDDLFRMIKAVVEGDEVQEPEGENLPEIWEFVKQKLIDNIEEYERVKARRLANLEKANAKKKLANAEQKQSECDANADHSQGVTVTDTVTDTVTVTGELISLRDLNSMGKEKVKKENPRTGFDKILDSDPTISNYPELRETYIGFIQMRKAIKKPLTDRGLQLIIGKVEKLAASPEDQIAILNQSIENSWQGVFELKQDKQLTTRSASMSAFDQFRQQEGLGPATSIFGG